MTLKMLRNLCLILGLGLTVAAVSAAPFVSPHGYSVTPPPGWQINPSHVGDDVVIDYKKNVATDGTPNLRVDITPMGGAATLEALKPAVISGYTKRFPGLVVKSQTFSSLGGVRDLNLVFTEPKNGILMYLHQIYVLKNGSAYIFTAVYPERSRAKYDAPVAQMLASVRWKP